MKTYVFNLGKMMIWGLLLILCVQPIFASVENKEKEHVAIQGEWKEGERSVVQDCPVSVSWDGSCLYVESTSSRSEIQVSLYDGTTMVYQAVIPQGDCPAVLYVGSLTVGELYDLVLTNQYGDRLEGIVTGRL